MCTTASLHPVRRAAWATPRFNFIGTPARVRVPSGKIRMFSPASSLRVISSSVSREPSFDM